MVIPDPLLVTPIRDVNDTIVMQTAVIGEADFLCTRDRDFFEPPAGAFLAKAGVTVLDDGSLIRRLRRLGVKDAWRWLLIALFLRSGRRQAKPPVPHERVYRGHPPPQLGVPQGTRKSEYCQSENSIWFILMGLAKTRD